MSGCHSLHRWGLCLKLATWEQPLLPLYPEQEFFTSIHKTWAGICESQTTILFYFDNCVWDIGWRVYVCVFLTRIGWYLNYIVSIIKNLFLLSYVASWIDQRERQTERAHLTILFEKYVPRCVEKMRKTFKTITPIPENSLVQVCHAYSK